MPDIDDDDDELDGCEEDFTEDPTPDDDVDGVVLFADVDPDDVDAIEKRTAEYETLFGGGSGAA